LALAFLDIGLAEGQSMTSEDVADIAFSGHERLTRETFAERTKALPLRARLVLKGLLDIEAGTLAMTLPEGQVFVIEGERPGPAAAVTLNNWNLVHRAVTGFAPIRAPAAAATSPSTTTSAMISIASGLTRR